MNRRFKSNRLRTWLLAAALLAVSATAGTHELDHVAAQHDTACALHLYSGHDGAMPAVAPDTLPESPRTTGISSPAAGITVTSRLTTPPARAPPRRT